MPTLHQFHLSGNCYKARLVARQVGVPLVLNDVDMMAGETRRPAFLAKNPNGRVPTLELDDGRFLPESNAIMLYLAEGSHLVPSDRFARAQMYQWLFFEQYSHEPNIASARFWVKFLPPEKLKGREARLDEMRKGGNEALAVMDGYLGKGDWFVNGRYSLADIALYAYTHCAEDGGFELARYPAVQAWLKRVEGTRDFISMEAR